MRRTGPRGAARSRSPAACRACTPHPAQRAQGTAVDELQGGQIDDDPRVASRGRREHGHDARGIYDIKFPVQRDDDLGLRRPTGDLQQQPRRR